MTRSISAAALKGMLHDEAELALVDVREDGQFGIDHMLHAVPCPYSTLEARIGALVPRKTARTVLVDAGDGVAEKAASILAGLGYADIAVLAGGNPAWRESGYERFEGVNVPSKAFGEIVEQVDGTPHITADELRGMIDRGEDLVILDGRTPAEHRRMSIPGGISVPNAEMVLRVHDLAPDPDTTVVVNCAGRTRSIIGAQGLINAGIPNRVVALKAGTMGWTLAGHALEHGSTRRYPEIVSERAHVAAAGYGAALLRRWGISAIDAETLERWRADEDRTLFFFDVRAEDEFLAGRLPGAVHAPGGQLVQATDRWCGVWGARVVLFDTPPGARAAVTAHWLRQMGWDVHVMIREPDGVTGEISGDAAPVLPAVDTITAGELADAIAADGAVVVDAGHSMDYRAGHLPTAAWAVRPRLDRLGIPPDRAVVVYSEHETRATLVARDLIASGTEGVAVLAGGRSAWVAGGRPLEDSPDTPADEDAIDFLFWVSSRHKGDDAAARAYLAWEENLPAQIVADGDARFVVAPLSP